VSPGVPPVTAVVPVKRLAAAKSRLALPPAQRRALALAFAVDTVTALSASPLVAGVVVVTSDPLVTWHLRRLTVRLVPDGGGDLDAVVRDGIHVASSWRPGSGTAVFPADLPCLRAVDATGVLARATVEPGTFVPDRSGRGTTVVVHRAGATAVTGYGPGSARRHLALGLRAMEDAPARARHDVDTLDDLEGARSLGVGPRTTAVLARTDPAKKTAGTAEAEAVLRRPRWQPTP
jgi:2-phospho-L-lactate/phosphoenolpyruvate guanylyltransferase